MERRFSPPFFSNAKEDAGGRKRSIGICVYPGNRSNVGIPGAIW
jgi:hypothetical protein